MSLQDQQLQTKATVDDNRAKVVRDGWTAFLSSFEWHYFATLTSRHSTTSERLVREFRRTVRRLERLSKLSLRWYYVVESVNDRPHLHVLLWSSRPLTAALVASQWRMGITHVRAYAREWGARYLAKELGKTEFDRYDLSPQLPPTFRGVSNGVWGVLEASEIHTLPHARDVEERAKRPMKNEGATSEGVAS